MWCVNWTHVIRHLTKLLQMQLATSKNFQERLMTHWLVGRRASKSSRVYPFRPPLHQFWESKLHLHLLLRLVVYPVPQFHRVKTVSCSYMFSVSCFAKLEAFPNCLEMFSPKFPQKLDTFFSSFFLQKGRTFSGQTWKLLVSPTAPRPRPYLELGTLPRQQTNGVG